MLTVFLTLCILTPYLLYVFLARYLALSDRRRKSPIVHTNELASSLVLGTALFYVGGYDESFDLFVLPATTHLAVVGYSLLAEFEDLHYSLPQIKSWPWTMRLVAGGAVLLVLLFSILHVHYAITLWGFRIALGGYLATFLILPCLTGLLCYALVRNERDSGIVGDVEVELSSTARALLNRPRTDTGASTSASSSRQDRSKRQAANSRQASKVDGDEEESVAMLPSAAQEEDEDALDALDRFDETSSLRNVPPVPLEHDIRPHTGILTTPAAVTTLGLGRTKLRFHLHHYQIFAYLALFTRFATFWSRTAAGLALGSMIHGLAAYGMDSLFAYEDDLG
ncbi:hypothetical protein BCR37DRAFT_381975 [Protomyces lactucae-debilis]|uniref:Uncharacterized protein n=1 Tax=Protomyces lactucae-debilis TaxID=2754530 RepID=A0A1Y2F6Q1_PROLT|nr:uncharacterized protein BCR37DRAFT_381975 [Protomyces lactucae-debilis]ORY79006.1 hypothetical protein BCR37DRAFT_381975 [Protomyces lactucae-debilis]